ncbi:MAG: response regulator [Pseudomonadales bacterium]|nr:response regulator [Pseudomonadales bacterium]
MNMNNSHPKILIVDDEPKNLYVLQRLLESLELTIIEASSGQAALKQALYHDFFLILMDAKMPDMSGFETARLLNGMKDTDHIPIIFVTAHDSDDISALEGYDSGAVDYITKPIEPTSLISKVSVFKRLWVQQIELKQYNQELEDFTRVVSHDLKQPLNSIIGLSTQVLRKNVKNLDQRNKDMLEIVIASGKRMSDMVNSLLSYAKADNQVLELKEVDLNLIVQNILDDLLHLIQKKHATINVGSLPVVTADAQQIYLVFLNIINNALKFQKPNIDPVISIQCEALIDTAYQTRISIADNGIGFNPDDFEDMLTPFHRLVGEDEFEGSGIGMGTVKRILDRHGARISANSTPGNGATFTLDL